jgi:predicted nucleic acid-binding protein
MNLLDTGIIIEMLKRHQFKPGFITSIIVLEILRGFEKEKRQPVRQLLKRSFTVIDMDDEISEAYCEIYRKLKQAGTLLPDADILIATTAIAHNLRLETNDDHFQRLRGLGLEISGYENNSVEESSVA